MLAILAAISLGVLTVGSYDVISESEQPGVLEKNGPKVAQVIHQQKQDQHPMLMQDYNH